MQTDAPITADASSSPAWRRSIAQGLELLLGAWVLDVMGLRLQHQLGGPEWLWELIGLIPSALEVIGFWMVTTPATDAVMSGAGKVARRITRWLAVVLAVSAVVDTACILAGLWAEGAALEFTLPILSMHMAVFALYLGCLATREGRPGFVWQTYVAFWGLAAGLIGLALSMQLLPDLEQPPGAGLQSAQLAPFLGSLVAVLVFGIWSLVLVWRYKKLFSVPPGPTAATGGGS